MSDDPVSVSRALADVPIEGRTCLEAGAGAGATSAYLAGRGADAVYAVTNDRDHAEHAREEADDAAVTLLEADLRSLPLPADAVDLVTAHALLNVVPPADLPAIATDLARVARPGARLVVVDYTPLSWTGDDPDGAVADLFALENAASHLARGRPALVFYPPAAVRAQLAAVGFEPGDTRLVASEVPWGRDLLDAHAGVVDDLAADLPDDLADPLRDRAAALLARVDEGELRHAAGMYAATFELARTRAAQSP